MFHSEGGGEVSRLDSEQAGRSSEKSKATVGTGAQWDGTAGNDKELAAVVDVWPNLPEHIRAAVLVLVNTTTKVGAR